MSLTQCRVNTNGFAFNCYYKPSETGLFVFHHGVGSSAKSFELVITELLKLQPDLGILCYDARFHGQTILFDGDSAQSTADNTADDVDLSIDSLVTDLHQILDHFQPSFNHNIKTVFVGHSMGATVMCKAVNLFNLNFIGIVMLEAVEGYARNALGSMHSLLAMWPKSFRSLDEAVKWHMRNQLRNKKSAEISVPQVLYETQGEYKWILNLQKTSPYWNQWFLNLDQMFLKAKCARLLVLAGTSKLDTDLTRAQMQGKFQFAVFSEAGHYIHEDVPEKCAELLAGFWNRNANPLQFIPKFGKIRTD